MNTLKLYDFKKLNGLKPTINSTFIKLEEEKGEVAQIIGKLRKMSGENTETISNEIIYDKLLEELMDITQVCATMIYILEDFTNIKLKNEEFLKIESCNSFNYVLKEFAILQGDIANKIHNIDDDIINIDLAKSLIPLFLNICSISCSSIYFVSEKANKPIESIKATHIDKLLKRGYLFI